jgi:hypothetical protein
MKKESQQEKTWGTSLLSCFLQQAASQLGNRVAAVGHRVSELPDPEAIKPRTYLPNLLGSTRNNCSVYGTTES